jgi:hypothetical protein
MQAEQTQRERSTEAHHAAVAAEPFEAIPAGTGVTAYTQAQPAPLSRSLSARRAAYRDPNLTFHPEIRPSSSLRPARTVDDLSRGDALHKQRWIEQQLEARDAEWKRRHPFQPKLVPPPRALAGVPAKLSLSSTHFIEHHQRRLAERQAMSQHQAQQRMVRLCCRSLASCLIWSSFCCMASTWWTTALF